MKSPKNAAKNEKIFVTFTKLLQKNYENISKIRKFKPNYENYI